jgi:hypothetical protein
MNKLEVHHIFPKARLYKADYRRAEVNAVANFCFLTKDTNLKISDKRPELYFPEVEKAHPGALASQWIPMDPELWKVENYLDFLSARRQLLAEATNSLLAELNHAPLEEAPEVPIEGPEVGEPSSPVPGGIESPEEERELEDLQEWLASHRLPRGTLLFELADPATGAPVALLDLAWPAGLQPGYSRPMAVLLNEPKETLEAATRHGFAFFTGVDAFKAHVLSEVLAQAPMEATQ